jgi:hypothetical protein
MSHFTVLVASKTRSVDEVLQPYHEYECTGVKDEYVKWIDEHDRLVSEYENGGSKWIDEPTEIPHKNRYATVEEFADDWEGISEKQDGRLGRWTNPNAKWDWFEVGGRWSDTLILKSGDRADQARKRDVDLEEMRRIEVGRLVRNWTKATEAIGDYKVIPFKDVFEAVRDREVAAEFYHKQPGVKAFKEAFPDSFFGDSAEDYAGIDASEYVKRKAPGAFTFAFCSENGWVANGEMGWFGMAFDQKEAAWDDVFATALATVPADWFLTVVDCHI